MWSQNLFKGKSALFPVDFPLHQSMDKPKDGGFPNYNQQNFQYYLYKYRSSHLVQLQPLKSTY